MGLALGALAGILGGLGGVPKGMAEGTAADQRQQQIDEQKRQFDQSRVTNLGTLAPILKAGGMALPEGVQGEVPTALVPTILSLSQKKADLAEKAAVGQDLQRQILERGTTTEMAPGASVTMPQPGTLMAPPPQAPMPSLTEKRVDPNMKALAGMVPGLLRTDPAAATALIKDTFIPQKPMALKEDEELVDPRSGQRIGAARSTSTAEPFTPPPGYVASYAQNAKGKVSTTWKPEGADKPEKTLEERVAMARELARANPGDAAAQANLARLEDAYKLALQKATAGATVIKPPEGGTIEKMATFNALIPLGQSLINQWKADPSIKPTGMARLGERELPGGFRPSDVIGQTQTNEQRRFMADVTDLIGTYRRIQSGLAVTNPEALRSLPLVPDNVGALQPQQLEALVAWAERNRGELDRALAAANKMPGPAPRPPATPPPTERETGPTPSSGAKRKKYNPATGLLE